jgi:hypothetical protein
MSKNKRLIAAIITGALLGIICIIGISLRMGFVGNELFILATYVNRLVMGLIIGLAAYYTIKKKNTNIFLRGLFFGIIISGSFYLATAFKDPLGFAAGIVYGVIIDFVATKYE